MESFPGRSGGGLSFSRGVVDFLSAQLSMLGCARRFVMCVIGSLEFLFYYYFFYFLLSNGMSLAVSRMFASVSFILSAWARVVGPSAAPRTQVMSFRISSTCSEVELFRTA